MRYSGVVKKITNNVATQNVGNEKSTNRNEEEILSKKESGYIPPKIPNGIEIKKVKNKANRFIINVHCRALYILPLTG
jgi:hypothetical protein